MDQLQLRFADQTLEKLFLQPTWHIYSVNPNFRESVAAKLAIEEAANRHFSEIFIEGDRQVVTNVTNCPSTSLDWSIFNILTDISTLLKSTAQKIYWIGIKTNGHKGLQHTCLAAYLLLSQCY